MREEEGLDELYAEPLDRFVEARDALAARLRDHDRDAAARVKKLRKPSVAAWAVNQLAHREPDAVQRVVHLRDEIEKAAGATEMRTAMAERRKMIAELVRRAQEVLVESGHAASGDTVQAITQTLHAGDTEDERDALVGGRLTRELAPSGLGGFGLALEDDREDDTDPRSEEKRQRADNLLREAEDADREAAAAERAVAEAERALDAARSRAEGARLAADDAARRAERARREVER